MKLDTRINLLAIASARYLIECNENQCIVIHKPDYYIKDKEKINETLRVQLRFDQIIDNLPTYNYRNIIIIK